jgi:hypothetical protein
MGRPRDFRSFTVRRSWRQAEVGEPAERRSTPGWLLLCELPPNSKPSFAENSQVIGFDLSQEEIDEQFAIGRDVFKLPVDEKLKHRADLEHGNYNG